MNPFKKLWLIAGPGVTTGAADDDPSGIATYSQTGAQFGYGQLWMAVFMLPFLIAIQEACARIAHVKGKGLCAVVREEYSKKVLYFIVLLILIANTINLGADIGAVAAAIELILPVNVDFLIILTALLTLALEIFLSYKIYAGFLKWLCLTLLAYPLTVFMVAEPWGVILKATFIPHIQLDFQFLFIITGVFGTTISPYLFFWQASQVVEEEREAKLLNSNNHSNQNKKYLKNLRIDNFFGMLFSEIATWAIIVVAATILNKNGITNIETAADAAKALEPLVQSFPHSGYLAKLIFAIGIIGLGLLSIPILAGSAAYAFTEAFHFKGGLNLKPTEGKIFYSIIIFSTLIGMLLNFIGVNPIKALIYSAVINGVVAVPLIFLITLIASNQKIMADFKTGWLSKLFLWLTFFCMFLAAIGMFFTFSKS